MEERIFTTADAEERKDGELLCHMRNMQQELMGFKRLVLTELVDIKERLTTRTDALLPQTPRETTPRGTGDTVMEPTTVEDSPGAHIPAGASLPEAPAPARREIPDQPVLPDVEDRK